MSAAPLLLTGASGFLGLHVGRELVQRGASFRAFARSARGGEWFARAGVRVERGDVGDLEACRRAVAGCPTVIHLAAAADVSAPAVNRRINLDGLTNVLRASREAGVERLLFVSSTCAGRDPRDAYGETKLQGEALVRASGLPFTILRPTMIYGPGSKEWDSFVGVIRWSPVVPILGTGRRVVQPVYVGDAVAALIAAATSPATLGATYDLAGREPVSFDDLVHAVARTLGLRRRIVHLPIAPVLAFARVLGHVFTHVPLTVDQVLAFAQDTRVDIGPLARDIGFAPVPLEAGLRGALRGGA